MKQNRMTGSPDDGRAFLRSRKNHKEIVMVSVFAGKPGSTMKKSAAIVLSSVGLALAGFSPTTVADIQIAFTESAPKDLFSFTNTGECDLTDLTVNIDLSNSAGGLIFDTTASGAGVEVFQPFEVVRGDISLSSALDVTDGDKDLTISIGQIGVSESVVFSIDVDDTMRKSALGMIRVTGSEIEGGMVSLSMADKTGLSAVFGSDSKAMLLLPECG